MAALVSKHSAVRDAVEQRPKARALGVEHVVEAGPGVP